MARPGRPTAIPPTRTASPGPACAGRAAGLAGGLHLDSGQGEAERAGSLDLAGPDFAVRLLASAEELITAPPLESVRDPGR
jgi:hypothetical protein